MPRIVSRVRPKVKHQLRKLRRKTTDKGLAMRCQIVLLWAEGEGPGAVARAVGCSPSWVARVVRRFADHGVAGLHDRREDNGQVKLDEAFLADLYAVVDTQPTDHGFPRPTWTQELLVEVMAGRTGTRVHPGTMSRALKLIGARLGRPKPTVGCPWPARRKNRRLAAIRRAVAGAVGPGEVAVHLDEVDVHLNPKVSPDWMNRGKQKHVPTPGTNAKRYVCGALDVNTGRLTCVAADAKNSQLFIATLERLLAANPRATAVHVVLDNFKIHSSKQVAAWTAERGGRITLHFLPPYCPDHNRIERLWRDLHADVTRNHRHSTIGSLMAAVWQWIGDRNRSSANAQRRRAA